VEVQVTRRRLAEGWGRAIYKTLVGDNGIAIQGLPPSGRPYIRVVSCPRLLTFMVKLARPADLSDVLKLGGQLALSLGVENCRVVRNFGDVIVEAPLPRTLWTNVDAETLKLKGGLWITLGNTSLMRPVSCKLNGHNIAPILVAGRTGSGKTEALRLMIWQLALQNEPKDLNIIVMDPKNGRLANFARLPHLAMPIAVTPEQGYEALKWLVWKLSKRLENGENSPSIVFFVDELIELMRVDMKTVAAALGRLAALGRERGIHLVLATQRPDRKYIDKLAVANLGLRLIGLVGDTTEATVAAGQGGTEAHKLCGAGDMIGVVAGSVNRLQIAYVKDTALDRLPKMDSPPPPSEFESIDLASMLTDGGNGGVQSNFTPSEIAAAMAGNGIMALKRLLGMGQPRAQRLRDNWAVPIMDKLGESGYVLSRKENA